MLRSAATCVILLVALVTSGHSLICDDPDDVNSGKCAQLSKELENALVQDAGNLYRLRKVFFHSATASPVLLKVLYNVTFTDNFVTAVDAEDIPNCSSSTLSNDTIELEQTNITLGWTSSGIYVVFHPTVLSVMQVQSPFAIIRLFHFTLDQRSPEADSFLWDGSYDLPTVQLNLRITSLTCVPSYDLLVSLLGELNQLLKLYGGRQMAIDVIDKDSVGSIGYTLPSTQVSSEYIPIGSDVIFINLYTSILGFLHAIIVCLIIIWYYGNTTVQNWIDNLINDERYADLLRGIRITSNTTLFVEVLIRAITIVIWTESSRYPLGTFLAVWSPNLQLLALTVALNIILNIYAILNGQCCNSKSRSGLRTFFTLYGTVFILLYISFPTIILTFAYPTRMIVIFAFVIAYLFATSIFSASIVRFYRAKTQSTLEILKIGFKGSKCTCNPRKWLCRRGGNFDIKKKLSYFLIFMFLWIVILYLHFLMGFALYELLVGGASVINTGPTLIISLFTPALLSSIVAMILKKSTLIKEKKERSDGGNRLQTLSQGNPLFEKTASKVEESSI